MNYPRIDLRSKSVTPLVTCIAILLATQAAPLSNAAQLNEDDEFRAGLIARYSDEKGNAIDRIDSRLSFVWNGDSPDHRIEAKAFKATWAGYLMTQSRGEYALSVYASGKVRIKLGDDVILDKESDQPAWMNARALELPFGWHPLEIQFEKTTADARVSLFWEGPGFQLEPIGERWFYHDRDKTPSESFRRGMTLVRALRCGACHSLPGQPDLLPAPSLDRLAGNISRKWIVDWLSSGEADRQAEQNESDSPLLARRMPHLSLSREEADCLSKYLLHQSRDSDKRKPAKDKAKVKTDLKEGKKLLLATGCLACHQFEGLGMTGLFDGGDLSLIAEKRPKDFFANWLSAPETLNRRHRMPVFSLTTKERNNLSAFLATCADKAAKDFVPLQLNKDDPNVAKGRQLFVKNRCSACHEKEDDSLPADGFELTEITQEADWKLGCIATAVRKPGQPQYQLDALSRKDIQMYFAEANRFEARPAETLAAGQLLAENNCLSCHARGLNVGLSSSVLEVAKAHRNLEPIVAAMAPPSLNSVGDKLHENALEEMIACKGKAHRPWLNVRMPRFALSECELKKLVRYFVDNDRIPQRSTAPKTTKLNKEELQFAGARLVTAAGFGCTSCHRVGDTEPPAAPLNTRGPDISQLGKRIRKSWYDRWVRDPARIVPKMEMPSVQVAVRGVLHDRLDVQLDAVWQALNQPGFQPPSPNPVRVVRRSGLPERRESAAVLTDVIQAHGNTYVKPFVIGLNNRHSVMLDLATNRLTGWWIGDVARQRTKGKTWFWESGGIELFQGVPTTSELTLEFDGELINPHASGQFVTEADQWRQITDGAELKHRLQFQLPGKGTTGKIVTLHVTQQVKSLPPNQESSGVARTVILRGIPEGAQPIYQIVDSSRLGQNAISGDKRSIELSSRSHVAIEKPEKATITKTGAIRIGSIESGKLEIVLRYETTLPVDKFPVGAPSIPSPATEALAIVPGFEAIRLPISDQWMPTGFSWKPNGALVVTSLKGRVWIASDSDGDGLEDNITPFSDELAAPYGVAAYDNHIDVINKYALLRLFDEDGDGQSDRTVTVASGWGHTTDYHDWVVGLPSDEAGNYYIAIPCQQDDRSEAAAFLHGSMITLTRRTPTADDPRLFALKEISGGHRFPMGIARQRSGDLFVTDNQGNYNPFNELNHVRQDARYGFINKLERKDGFAPKLTPPAINIPHPWTRSVNGVCFLETPQQVQARTGVDVFGPFEGHLIGCEYDTRRLIRMSLQKVGDTYQGAAYPFSFDKPKEGTPLLGPLTCAIAPGGNLYVGSIRDSGWGGANNVGSIVRLKPLASEIPPGIAEVRARHDGFEIEFTVPVDAARAMSKSNYSVSSYTRASTPAYGGPDQDRRAEAIRKVEVNENSRGVRLRMDNLRKGFVYEFRLKNLAVGEGLFFPDEAFYTLNQIPQK